MLIGFNFDLKFTGTKQFGYADALSRLIVAHSDRQPDEDSIIALIVVDGEVNAVLRQSLEQLPVTAELIRHETNLDPKLRTVLQYVSNGWPNALEDNELKEFDNRRFALTSTQGCLLLGDRVIIPLKLGNMVLKQLHNGHSGISHSFAYWPYMDKKIETVVKTCDACCMASEMPP